MRSSSYAVAIWKRGEPLPVDARDLMNKQLRAEDINVRIAGADLFFARVCARVLVSKGLETEVAEKEVSAVINRSTRGDYERVTHEIASLLKPPGARASVKEVMLFRSEIENDLQLALQLPEIGTSPHPWTTSLLDELTRLGAPQRVICRTTAPTRWAESLNRHFGLPEASFKRPEIQPNWDSMFQNPGSLLGETIHRRKVLAIVHSKFLFRQAIEGRTGTTIFICPELATDRTIAEVVIDSFHRTKLSEEAQPAIYLIAPDIQSWSQDDVHSESVPHEREKRARGETEEKNHELNEEAA